MHLRLKSIVNRGPEHVDVSSEFASSIFNSSEAFESKRIFLKGEAGSGKSHILQIVEESEKIDHLGIVKISQRNASFLVVDESNLFRGCIENLPITNNTGLSLDALISESKILFILDDIESILKAAKGPQRRVIEAILETSSHKFSFIASGRALPELLVSKNKYGEIFPRDKTVHFFDIEPLNLTESEAFIHLLEGDFSKVKDYLRQLNLDSYISNPGMLKNVVELHNSDEFVGPVGGTRADLYLDLITRRVRDINLDAGLNLDGRVISIRDILSLCGWQLYLDSRGMFQLKDLVALAAEIWSELGQSCESTLEQLLTDLGFSKVLFNEEEYYELRDEAVGSFLLSLIWQEMGLPPEWLCLEVPTLLGNWVGISKDVSEAAKEATDLLLKNNRPDLVVDILLANSGGMDSQSKGVIWGQLGIVLIKGSRRNRDLLVERISSIRSVFIREGINFGFLKVVEGINESLAEEITEDLIAERFTSERYQYLRRKRNYTSGDPVKLPRWINPIVRKFQSSKNSEEEVNQIKDDLSPFAAGLNPGMLTAMAFDEDRPRYQSLAAISLLGRANNRRYLSRILVHLDRFSEDEEALGTVITALGRCGHYNAAPILNGMITDHSISAKLKGQLTTAIGRIGHKSAQDILCNQFISLYNSNATLERDEQFEILLGSTIKAIGTIGVATEECGDQLVEFLADTAQNERNRCVSAITLKRIGYANRKDILYKIIFNNAEDFDVRRNCVNSLSHDLENLETSELAKLLSNAVETKKLEGEKGEKNSIFAASMVHALSRLGQKNDPNLLIDLILTEGLNSYLLYSCINILTNSRFVKIQLLLLKKAQDESHPESVRIAIYRTLLGSIPDKTIDLVLSELEDDGVSEDHETNLIKLLTRHVSIFSEDQLFRILEVMHLTELEEDCNFLKKIINIVRVKSFQKTMGLLVDIIRSSIFVDVRISAARTLASFKTTTSQSLLLDMTSVSRVSLEERYATLTSLSLYGSLKKSVVYDTIWRDRNTVLAGIKNPKTKQKTLKILKERKKLVRPVLSIVFTRYLINHLLQKRRPKNFRLHLSKEALNIYHAVRSDCNKYADKRSYNSPQLRSMVRFLITYLQTPNSNSIETKQKATILKNLVVTFDRVEVQSDILREFIGTISRNPSKALLPLLKSIISNYSFSDSIRINAIRVYSAIDPNLDFEFRSLLWIKKGRKLFLNVESGNAVRGRLVKAISNIQTGAVEQRNGWKKALSFVASFDTDPKNRTSACFALTKLDMFPTSLIESLLDSSTTYPMSGKPGCDGDDGVIASCCIEVLGQFIKKNVQPELMGVVVEKIINVNTGYGVISPVLRFIEEQSIEDQASLMSVISNRTSQSHLEDNQLSSAFRDRLKRWESSLIRAMEQEKARAALLSKFPTYYRNLRELSSDNDVLSVLLFCIRPRECLAMKQFLSSKCSVTGSSDSKFSWVNSQGSAIDIRAVSLNAKKGQSSGARVAEFLDIEDTNKQYDIAILIGCARGIDDTKLSVGDVVISDNIYSLIRRQGTSDPSRKKMELETHPLNINIDMADTARTMISSEYCIPTSEEYQLVVGSVASEDVVDKGIDPEEGFATEFKDRNILIKEMEAGGFMNALLRKPTHGIVIKGISDHGHDLESSKDKQQGIATKHALDAAFKFIEAISNDFEYG